MAWIGIGAMFNNNFIIRFEECSKWKTFDLGVAFGANDDLVQEPDI